MAHLDLYETPSNEILRHRRGFYDLWKRCDDQTAAWLDRVQSQISLCEFPPLISREYLLIDKFLCELDDDERAFIQSVDTWTLIKLKDFVERQMPSLLPSSKTVAVECELDGYEYSENIANIEMADETNSFAVIKSEPNTLTDDDFSTTVSFSDDNEAGYASIELDSDTINEILLNDMECEVEDYKFSISAATENTNGKQSIHTAKRKSVKQSVVHREILPRKCQDCEKYFVSADEFQRHFCEHSRVKSFACGECFESFISAYSLGVHRRAAHSNITPFLCDICDKRFRSYSLIRRHMIRHTGKRPYQCDQCDRSFARKTYMKIHKKRIHQKFRSHRCQECDKCFINSYELNLHMSRHSGYKPFECEHCDKRFFSISNLKGHVRRIHE